VAITNIKLSTLHNFSCPKILEEKKDSSYLELLALRHPLVEAREENGIYIPNDIVMGDKSYMDELSTKAMISQINKNDVNGVLLYGINSSGKSSLMKSLGICLILAQSGFYVPAQRMRFTLFKEIFTRIIAQDNFEKGLSSFAVEMLEMKNIFNRATPKSLILGDEISQGTETLSALAIVGATIKRLSKAKSLFVFTTHLHQLHNLDILNSLKNVVSVHLHVSYDDKNDILIFDRNLQAGSGSSIYGLEFAQSLHMDNEFLGLAANLRKNLAHENDDLKLLTKRQTSSYNKKLFITNCAICDKEVSQVHHINEQKLADKDGHIKNFHKDHKYNLLPVCEKCHLKIHQNKIKIKIRQ
jgi:DNA mismatch repair protein MutS